MTRGGENRTLDKTINGALNSVKYKMEVLSCGHIPIRSVINEDVCLAWRYLGAPCELVTEYMKTEIRS